MAGGVNLEVLRNAKRGTEAHIDRTRAAPPKTLRRPPNKGTIMRIIAKVIESMLSKDATQRWTGQTSAVQSNNVWGWNPLSEETAPIC